MIDLSFVSFSEYRQPMTWSSYSDSILMCDVVASLQRELKESSLSKDDPMSYHVRLISLQFSSVFIVLTRFSKQN